MGGVIGAVATVVVICVILAIVIVLCCFAKRKSPVEHEKLKELEMKPKDVPTENVYT